MSGIYLSRALDVEGGCLLVSCVRFYIGFVLIDDSAGH